MVPVVNIRASFAAGGVAELVTDDRLRLLFIRVDAVDGSRKHFGEAGGVFSHRCELTIAMDREKRAALYKR